MQDIFFILGTHPALSIAEIVAVARARGIEVHPLAISDEVVVTGVPEGTVIDIAWFGGVVKWGYILREGDMNPTSDFGFSVYRGDMTVADSALEKQWSRVQKIGMEKKRHALRASHPIRFVTSRARQLSSVIVEKELHRHEGKEYVWIVRSDDVLLGATEAVQAFEEFGSRDYGRPGFDARSGMLPPKLAKIMVNLAAPSHVSKRRGLLETSVPVILDPFCGSGTILQEALLLGYNVIGADKSPSAIKDTKKNLDWLINNYSVTQLPSHQIFQSDVRQLSKKLSTQVDAIVTEPSLGPALRKVPTPELLKPILDSLTTLYIDAFKSFDQLVKPGGSVVIIFPVFQTAPPTFLSRRVLPRIAWAPVNPLPEDLRQYPTLTLTPSNMLLYGRPGQKVWREIGIFTNHESTTNLRIR